MYSEKDQKRVGWQYRSEDGYGVPSKVNYDDPSDVSSLNVIDAPIFNVPSHTLRSLQLKNFKVVNEASILLKPLTVIVGRNSSGKSTLLQAILAMAQNAQELSVNRNFSFNGKFKTLGTFQQVQNETASKHFENLVL